MCRRIFSDEIDSNYFIYPEKSIEEKLKRKKINAFALLLDFAHLWRALNKH